MSFKFFLIFNKSKLLPTFKITYLSFALVCISDVGLQIS